MPSIKIKGMSCQHCVQSVTNAIKGIEGITDVTVSLENKEATYTESQPVDTAKIKQAVKEIGFEAE